MDAEKKVAIITGASGAIGSALVAAFSERNYRVVANSRKIRAFLDPDVLAIPGDLSDPETSQRIVSETTQRFGRVDTLVNNASICLARPFTEYTEEDYHLVLSINLGGFLHLTKRVAAEMLKHGSGHIVQITTGIIDDVNSQFPSALGSLTRGGLVAVTKSLAIEYASRGIRVNAVTPGIIKTPMHGSQSHESPSRLNPIGRLGEARDIVEAILFLEGATFVTGEILHVDGGQRQAAEGGGLYSI